MLEPELKNASQNLSDSLLDDFTRSQYMPELLLLERYSEITNNTKPRHHAERVFTILRDFTDGKVDPLVYSAALLLDITPRLDDPIEGKNAASVLKTYAQWTATTPGQWEFVSSILSDISLVDKVSKSARFEHAESDLELRAALQTGAVEQVPIRLWKATSTLADPVKMLELLQDVNIETVLLMSAKKLDELSNPSDNETKQLQDVFDAESFYAPICEILGYDALAMALHSEAARTRMIKSGNEAFIAEAETEIAALGDRDEVLGIVGDIYHHLMAGDRVTEHAITNKGQHNVVLGESLLIEPFKGISDLRAIWRVKTPGSHASKLERQGRRPADVLGITLIANTASEIGIAFAGMVRRVQQNPSFEPTTSASRDYAYHVRGSARYIGKILGHKEFKGAVDFSAIDIVRNRSAAGFQVAKLTAVYLMQAEGVEKRIPFEVQFQTEKDREKSRVGQASHIIYKGREQPNPQEFNVAVLQEIKQRKQMIGRHIAIESSKKRGAELRQKIARSNARLFFTESLNTRSRRKR